MCCVMAVLPLIPAPATLFQVSYLANIVRYGETPETSFNQWAWSLVLRLKLHRNDRGVQQSGLAVPVCDSALDTAESITLHPLLKAVKANVPIGCYLALAMTTLGHRWGLFGCVPWLDGPRD